MKRKSLLWICEVSEKHSPVCVPPVTGYSQFPSASLRFQREREAQDASSCTVNFSGTGRNMELSKNSSLNRYGSLTTTVKTKNVFKVEEVCATAVLTRTHRRSTEETFVLGRVGNSTYTERGWEVLQ